MKNTMRLKHKLHLTSPQVIVIGFFIVILIGAVLLTLPIATRSRTSAGFLDALFTATTSTCVTGLVVHDTYSYWSVFGQVVILCLIQVGGLGFMTVATVFSLAIRRKISFNERLLISESLSQDTAQGMVRLTQHIIIGTLLFEGSGAVILAAKFIPMMGIGKGIYKGIFHSISAFCNAGIDLMGEIEPYSSLTHFTGDWIISCTIMALIVIGGLGFAVWEDIYRVNRLKDLSTHSKLVLLMTASLIVGGAIIYFGLECTNPGTIGRLPFGQQVLASFFQSVTPRTAGFNTVSLDKMRNATVLLMVILMFIGAAPGSTGGGIKVSTFGIIILSIWSIMRNHGEVIINKKRIGHSIVFRSMIIFIIGMGVVTLGVFLVCMTNSFSIRDVLFEVVSAFGTVGLSMGITPHLNGIGKFVLICIMYLGRVGVMTMALSLSSRSSEAKKNVRYPEARILI